MPSGRRYLATPFIVWQSINFLAFRTVPTAPIMIGGSLVIVGRAIITFWKPGLARSEVDSEEGAQKRILYDKMEFRANFSTNSKTCNTLVTRSENEPPGMRFSGSWMHPPRALVLGPPLEKDPAQSRSYVTGFQCLATGVAEHETLARRLRRTRSRCHCGTTGRCSCGCLPPRGMRVCNQLVGRRRTLTRMAEGRTR